MYIYDQGRTSVVSPGIGRLDAFAKSPKQTVPNPAEAYRHLDEMWKLKDRSWSGVDSHFLEWRKVRDKDKLGEGYKKGWEIYQLAAQAAMELGDAASRYERLITAMILTVRDRELNAIGSQAEKDRVLHELLAGKLDLENNWVDVDISLLRKSEGHLRRANRPFSPEEKDRSMALERAKNMLRNEKRFQGLLPIGDYTIDGEAISLGTTFTIPRWKKAIIRQKKNRPLDSQLESKEPSLPLEGLATTACRLEG